MLALLKLVPLKDWLYCALLVFVLICVGLYTHHERAVGAAKLTAAAQRAVIAQKIETEKVIKNANLQIQAAALAAHAAVAAPPIDSPHVWVQKCPANRPRTVPADSRPQSIVHAPAADTGSHPIDVGPGLDTIGRDADAEIVYLQSYIQACQRAGYCKTE